MGSATLELKANTLPLKTIEEKASQTLKKLETKSLMDLLGQEILAKTMARFNEGISPDGTKWKRTLRESLGDGKPTLHGAGGKLAQSHTVQADSKSVEIGSNKEYAAIHHFGGIIKPKKGKFLVFNLNGQTVFAKKVIIPARPALGINREDEENLLETTDEWLEMKLRAFRG